MLVSTNAPGSMARAIWSHVSPGQWQFQIVRSSNLFSILQVVGGPLKGLHSSLAIDPSPLLMSNSNGIEWQLDGVTARLVVTRRNRSSVKIDVFMMSKPFEDGRNTFAHVCVGLSLSEIISQTRFPATVPATIERKKAGASYRWISARPQYLSCVSNGDTAVLYYAIGIYYVMIICMMQ